MKKITRKDLLIYWWVNYLTEPYKQEDFEAFKNLVDKEEDRISKLLVNSILSNEGSEVILFAIKVKHVEALLSCILDMRFFSKETIDEFNFYYDTIFESLEENYKNKTNKPLIIIKDNGVQESSKTYQLSKLN